MIIVLVIVIAASQGQKMANQNNNQNSNQASNETASSTPEPEKVMPIAEIPKETRVEAPNANPITKDNKVINMQGQVTRNDVAQTSVLAPSETGPLKAEQVAPTAIKLTISAAGYNPKEINVKAGAPITIAVTSTDKYAHSFVFEDASLSAIGVGVYGGETRAVTFNAPTKAGEYVFYCNVGNHRDRGEVGKLIVK